MLILLYKLARNGSSSTATARSKYGKKATPKLLATTLGGKLKDTHKLKATAE